MDQRPIGVFDSGLGGLTAARTLEALLPGENIIYFGDSRNAPYGTRAIPALRTLAAANAGFLRSFDCKAILVACGTVSSNAMEHLRKVYPEVPFFDVIDAACDAAAQCAGRGPVAVAATEATVRSGAFERALHDRRGDARVISKACQSLVALAEQGHFAPEDPLAKAAVEAEFAPLRDAQPEALLLACTHFPLFAPLISACMGPETRLLSVGEETAKALAAWLGAQNALAQRAEGERRYFTSGDPAEFARLGAVFLGHTITAEQHINRESENL